MVFCMGRAEDCIFVGPPDALSRSAGDREDLRLFPGLLDPPRDGGGDCFWCRLRSFCLLGEFPERGKGRCLDVADSLSFLDSRPGDERRFGRGRSCDILLDLGGLSLDRGRLCGEVCRGFRNAGGGDLERSRGPGTYESPKRPAAPLNSANVDE